MMDYAIILEDYILALPSGSNHGQSSKRFDKIKEISHRVFNKLKEFIKKIIAAIRRLKLKIKDFLANRDRYKTNYDAKMVNKLAKFSTEQTTVDRYIKTYCRVFPSIAKDIEREYTNLKSMLQSTTVDKDEANKLLDRFRGIEDSAEQIKMDIQTHIQTASKVKRASFSASQDIIRQIIQPSLNSVQHTAEEINQLIFYSQNLLDNAIESEDENQIRTVRGAMSLIEGCVRAINTLSTVSNTILTEYLTV